MIEPIEAVAYYRCPICGTLYTTMELAMECREQGRYNSDLKEGVFYEWKEQETKDGCLNMEGRFLRVGYKNGSKHSNLWNSLNLAILCKVITHEWHLIFELTSFPQLCEYPLYRLPKSFKEIDAFQD